MTAKKGTTIFGEDIIKAREESKKTGLPLAKTIQNIKNVGNIETIITPGNAVPDMSKRSGGRSKKR